MTWRESTEELAAGNFGVIKDIIYSMCSPHGEREAVLQQELVIHIGWIISNNPELFSGMLKIRVGWIVQAMKHELKIRAGDMPPQDIYQMSPSAVKQLLLDVLQPQQTGRSWLNRRQIDGSLYRTPLGFYDRVWQILERTRNGIMLGGKHLPQLLMVVSYMLERNPELEFQEAVDLHRLVKDAFAGFQKDHSRLDRSEKENNMEAFYNTPALGKRNTSSYLSKAVMIQLLQGENNMEAFYNTPALGKRNTSSYLSKAVMIQLLQGEVKPSKDDPCSVS